MTVGFKLRVAVLLKADKVLNIFKNIHYQVFTPDKSNGMDVQSESDAKLDHDRKQKEMALLALGKNRYCGFHK